MFFLTFNRLALCKNNPSNYKLIIDFFFLFLQRLLTFGIDFSCFNLFFPNAPQGFLMFQGGRERVHWERTAKRFFNNRINERLFMNRCIVVSSNVSL